MTETLRVETITCDEPLGIRENAHLTYLGSQLAHHGVEPAANIVIRDHPEDIKNFFKDSWQRSDVVITVVWAQLLMTSPEKQSQKSSKKSLSMYFHRRRDS